MNLEDITLSKISQSQKDKCCMISLIRSIQSNQTHINRKWNGSCQGLGGTEEWGVVINAHRVSVLQDEKVLKIGCTTM